MKVFLVFMGLLLINVSFLVYQGDMNRYVRIQEFLKASAEECAAGASLYYDEDYYSDGTFVFDYEEGRRYAEEFLKRAEKRMPLPRSSSISLEMSFEDDLKGYEKDSIPAVEVKLSAQTGDLFRLPFLKRDTVVRMAKYELPEA